MSFYYELGPKFNYSNKYYETLFELCDEIDCVSLDNNVPPTSLFNLATLSEILRLSKTLPDIMEYKDADIDLSSL
jgi:hypothetical protein